MTPPAVLGNLLPAASRDAHRGTNKTLDALTERSCSARRPPDCDPAVRRTAKNPKSARIERITMSMMPSQKPAGVRLDQLPDYLKGHPWAPVALWVALLLALWLT